MKRYNLFLLALTLPALTLLSGCLGDEVDPDSFSDYIIMRDTTWSAKQPIRLSGRIEIRKGTLTIEEGAKILFSQGASLIVEGDKGGALLLQGTSGNPVTLKPSEEGKTWGGLHILGNSTKSRLTHCEIISAGSQGNPALKVSNLNFPISNIKISNSPGSGLEILKGHENSTPWLNNCTIEGRGGHGITGDASLLLTLGNNITMRLGDFYGIELNSGTVRTSELTIRNHGVPYFINAPIQLDGKITISSGNKFLIERNGSLDFGCNQTTSLNVSGTIFSTSLPEKKPGSRGDVVINTYVSSSSVLDNCTFEYGGRGAAYAAGLVVYEVKNLAVRNCTFQYNVGYGIALIGGATLANGTEGENNRFYENTSGNAGKLRGGKAAPKQSLLHQTLPLPNSKTFHTYLFR